jgi:hypothetical protein
MPWCSIYSQNPPQKKDMAKFDESDDEDDDDLYVEGQLYMTYPIRGK